MTVIIYILCQIKPHYLTLDFLFKLTLNYFCHKRPSTTIGIGIKKHVTYFMTRSCFFIFKLIVSKANLCKGITSQDACGQAGQTNSFLPSLHLICDLSSAKSQIGKPHDIGVYGKIFVKSL